MSKKMLALIVVIIVVAAAAGYVGYSALTAPTAPPTPAPAPPGPPPGPIKIAILYDPTIAVLKYQGEAVKVAIEEINKAGGILGRRIEYKEYNTMRRVDVAVAVYREALIEFGAKYIILEGVSEEMLALMEEGAKLYRQYPHVLMYCGMAGEVTIKVINEYEKYKFAFRIFDTDYEANVIRPAAILWDARFTMGTKKVALLIEDAAWTLGARVGLRAVTKFGTIDQKPLREIAKDLGLEVVYEATFPVGCKDFLPYLEAAAARGAGFIFAMTSWYTDCVTLVKQWSVSAARDIYLGLYGGPNHWSRIFWNLTGGAALGVLSGVFDVLDYPPVSPYTRSFIAKMLEKRFPVDMSAHYYYSAVYHIKAAIEEAGDPDNIDAVIKALETVPCKEHTLIPAGRAFLGDISITFHSYPALNAFYFQFQEGGKVVCVSNPDNPYLLVHYSKEFLKEYGKPGLLKPPAELRKRVGG
ncbi:MAG: ABC transporter substrate-binding protein [Candidatus Nezhaarchaeota archaeon]|nr:ABC transporter substrate-binding protein [Candidatus Nezhaarchaeota archaeon]